MGIRTGRSTLQRWSKRHDIQRVAIWGRGKACEQIMDICREARLLIHAVFDQYIESNSWRSAPLAHENTFQPSKVDGIIVGTLSPGVGEDQLNALREKFPDTPRVCLAEWTPAAIPA